MAPLESGLEQAYLSHRTMLEAAGKLNVLESVFCLVAATSVQLRFLTLSSAYRRTSFTPMLVPPSNLRKTRGGKK